MIPIEQKEGQTTLTEIINSGFINIIPKGLLVRRWVRTTKENDNTPKLVEHLEFNKKTGCYNKKTI